MVVNKTVAAITARSAAAEEHIGKVIKNHGKAAAAKVENSQPRGYGAPGHRDVYVVDPLVPGMTTSASLLTTTF